MKAFSLVLMLFIGMISSMGFGLTTADLTENSTTVTPMVSHDMVTANVATVNVFKLNEVFNLNSRSEDASFKLFEINKENYLLITTFEATSTNPLTIEGDVGWQSIFENYNKQPQNSINLIKQPRDGLVTPLIFLS